MIEFVYYTEIDNLKEIIENQKDDWDKIEVIEIDKIEEIKFVVTTDKENQKVEMKDMGLQ